MSGREHDADHPASPLSDDQAMAQVIEPAKQIIKVAGLDDPSGGFYLGSCNDQGDPPYRGVVEMSFKWPPDGSKGHPAEVDGNVYFSQLAATMVAHGWSDGPPPGSHPYGRVINKDGVMAIMSQSPSSGRGSIKLYGECRDMTDHHGDDMTTGFDITEQLRTG